MIGRVFHQSIYLPLYNGLVFLIGIVPGSDVGIAVILLTLLVKLVLLPISLRVARTQEEQKKIAPLVDELRRKHKGNRRAEAEALMALYREHNIRPFLGILLLFLQLPVLLGLYFVFAKGGFTAINFTELYRFVSVPVSANMEFLGLINMGAPSATLAILAGVSQFTYAMIATPAAAPESKGFQADLAKSIQIQVKYVLPAIITLIAWHIASAVPLYWVTSNLFMIGQEYFVRWRLRGKL